MEGSILTQVVLPLCLFLIMFGMGLSLTPPDFARVVQKPKAVSLGLIGQLLVLPCIGFAIAASIASTPALAIGIMLLAACPGGTTSNLIAYLAKGDVALSITLTAFSSLITLVTIPLILALSMTSFATETQDVQVPTSNIVGVLVAITLIPVSLGMLVRHWKEAWAFYLEPKISRFSSIFLVALVIMIIVEQREMLMNTLGEVWLSAALLNLSTMGIAGLAARLSKLGREQTISLIVEVGIQNGALAILLATTVLQDSALAVPAAIYSLMMYISGGALIICRKYRIF